MLPIRVTASFQAEDQPDFEKYEMTASTEDIRNSNWKEIWVNAEHISAIWRKEEFSIMELAYSQGFTIKETPEEVARRIQNRQQQKFIVGLN